MSRNLEIANEIWRQMNIMDKNLCWCMGVHDKVVIENGLRFKVNGLIFKGTVEVKLNGKDLYDVYLYNNKRVYYVNDLDAGIKRYTHKLELFKEMNDLFFDDLMPYLESVVERPHKELEQETVEMCGK